MILAQHAPYDFDTILERHGSSSAKWHEVVEQMGEDGKDVVPLSVADMEFKPAPEVVEALIQSATHDVFGYDYATEDYFTAFLNWMEHRHNFHIDPSWVSLSDGVMPAVNTALRSVTRPGDKVIIQRPVYYPFTFAAEHNGLTILDNELVLDENGHYGIDFDDLESKAADPRCTAMILCNPHNPIGKLYDAEELARIGELCRKHHVLVIADEIHCDLTLDGHRHIPFASLNEEFLRHSVTCTAPSKTFNIAGLQAANIIAADPEIRRKIDRQLVDNELHALNAFAVEALIAAYNEGGEWLDELKKYLWENYEYLRDFFTRHLPALPVTPLEATYLVWVDCRTLKRPTTEIARQLLEEEHVWINEGEMYAGEGFLRINIACPRKTLAEGLERIRKVLG